MLETMITVSQAITLPSFLGRKQGLQRMRYTPRSGALPMSHGVAIEGYKVPSEINVPFLIVPVVHCQLACAQRYSFLYRVTPWFFS
jgi:hypothetical protein